MVLPVGTYFLFGSRFHRFGHSLSHAQGFSLVSRPSAYSSPHGEKFRQPGDRVIFFGFLGTLVAFFDLMHGWNPGGLVAGDRAQPSLVLPRVRGSTRCRTDHRSRYWFVAFREAVIVCLCFVVAYGCAHSGPTALAEPIHRRKRAPVPGLAGDSTGQSDSRPRSVSLEDVIQKLWQARFQLTPGGFTPSTSMLLVSFTACIFTSGLLPDCSCWRRGKTSLAVLADLSVVVLATWVCWRGIACSGSTRHSCSFRRPGMPRFPRRTVARGRLVVRSLAGARSGALRWATVDRCGVAQWPPRPALMEGTMSAVTSAGLVDQPVVDEVACAPVGLKSDGKPDGLIELAWKHDPGLASISDHRVASARDSAR